MFKLKPVMERRTLDHKVAVAASAAQTDLSANLITKDEKTFTRSGKGDTARLGTSTFPDKCEVPLTSHLNERWYLRWTREGGKRRVMYFVAVRSGRDGAFLLHTVAKCSSGSLGLSREVAASLARQCRCFSDKQSRARCRLPLAIELREGQSTSRKHISVCRQDIYTRRRRECLLSDRDLVTCRPSMIEQLVYNRRQAFELGLAGTPGLSCRTNLAARGFTRKVISRLFRQARTEG